METRKNRILANIEFLKSTEEVYEDGPWPDIMTRDEMKEHGVEQ
jgi:hypothetical protein